MNAIYEKYKSQVGHPGKFEHEQPYVPYYWDQFLEGGADRDDEYGEGIIEFDVSEEDVELFPELKGKCVVKLTELSNGFVVGVAK